MCLTISNKNRPLIIVSENDWFYLQRRLLVLLFLPNSVDMLDKPQNQVVVNPKLSPQMVEDLEMLMVLGEDKVQHGS